MNNMKSVSMWVLGLVLLVTTLVALSNHAGKSVDNDAAPSNIAIVENSPSNGLFGRPVLASGAAIATEEDAEDAAIAEIPSGLNPVNPVARLLTAIDVGKWLGSCLPWRDERPHWLVGVETDSVPDWFGTGHTSPSNSNVGVYLVLDANEGVMVAFGALDSSGYDDIGNMSSASLSISYETAMPPDAGVPTNQAGPNATQALATMTAVVGGEAACRSTYW